MNRVSFEMLVAWEAKGTPRQDLLKKWWEDASVANVSAELILTEKHVESGAQPGIFLCSLPIINLSPDI